MNPHTLARQRITGERPYKVPVTDWRRQRWAVPVHPVSADQLRAIVTAAGAAVEVALRRVFVVEVKRKGKQ